MSVTQFRPFRAIVVGTLITSCFLVVILAGWLLWPAFKDYSIQQAVLQHEVSTTPPRWWPTSWRQEWRARTKLMELVTLEFVETPLSDVCDFVHDYSELEIRFDKPALDAMGVTNDLPVTVHVQEVSLRTALVLILHRRDLALLIQDGSLVITSKLAAGNDLNPRHSPAFIAYGAESLSNESVRIRREAACSVATMPSRSGMSQAALLRAFQDDDREVRVLIAFTMCQLGRDALPPIRSLVAALRDRDEVFRWLIATAGPDAIPPLLEALKNGDAQARASAAATLGEFLPEHSKIVPHLLAAMRDSDNLVVNEVIGSLQEVGPTLMPRAVALLRDPNSTARANAVWLVYLLHHPRTKAEVIQHLTGAIADEDAAVRLNAARVLCMFKSDAECAAPEITKLLQDDNAEVRVMAAFSLWRILRQADLVLPTLRAELENANESVSANARSIVKTIEATSPSRPSVP